jgi:PAS domain-containing protein
MATNDAVNNYDLLLYLLYPIIVGVYFFGFPQSILISATILLITLGYTFVFPEVPRDTVINGPFSVLLVFAIMMHILKSYRGTVEYDRQRDLREHEERYRALLETSYEGICSQVGGKIIEVNPGFEHLFGFDPGQALGKEVRSLPVQEGQPGAGWQT